ncbi:hypothetical protein OUZ56_006488 [Daphnia magna]|uniref:Uncharacterized protein n=1 Tax=Daphnia magna TaxID=35525 RepID=A0ABQ9YX49_9CRUS|nr:hypothetical protein OUZ56_006488 [Daphnia magna]
MPDSSHRHSKREIGLDVRERGLNKRRFTLLYGQEKMIQELEIALNISEFAADSINNVHNLK